MIDITFEAAVGFLGIWVFLMFLVACLIIGLYYMADVVEENLAKTKRALTWASLGTLATLALLAVLHAETWRCIIPSALAQLGYYRMLKGGRFPFVGLSEPSLWLPALASGVAHVMWMRYHLTTYHHVGVVLGFFLITVWMVPFGILISLAANENCLPGAASGMPVSYYNPAAAAAAPPPAAAAARQKGRGTRTLFASMFDAFRTRTDRAADRNKYG